MNENIEKRILVSSEDIRFRAIEKDGKRFIEGYAAVFNKRSKLIMEFGELFYEELEKGSFDDVLRQNPDVYFSPNHSRDQLIARTTNDTLTLKADKTGLFMRAEVPDVSYANDLYTLIANETLFEMSFAFSVDPEGFRWSETDEGVPLRIITKVRNLVDVSVVTKGAYADTTVAARELKEHRDSSAETTVETENEEPETVVEEEVEEPKNDTSEQDRMKMKIRI